MEKEALSYYKKKLLDVTTILLERGVYEYTAGHASVRIPGTDLILIPGHIHPERRTIGSLTEEDISLMDLDGKLVEGKLKPPGEKYIHTEIYKLRKDVGSVIHMHPKVVNALSIAGKEILPISLHSVIFHPKVPIHPSPVNVNSPELGRELAELLGKGYAVVQQGHGAIVVGKDLEQACVVGLFLEDTAEMQLMAMSVGAPKILPEKYRQDKQTVGVEDWEFFGNAWVYFYNKHIKKRS